MTCVWVQRFRTGCGSMNLSMGYQKRGNKISDPGNSELEEVGQTEAPVSKGCIENKNQITMKVQTKDIP